MSAIAAERLRPSAHCVEKVGFQELEKFRQIAEHLEISVRLRAIADELLLER